MPLTCATTGVKMPESPISAAEPAGGCNADQPLTLTRSLGMAKAASQNTSDVTKSKPNNSIHHNERLVPMPASQEGWVACQRLSLLSFWILENDREAWSLAVLPDPEDFLEAAIALRKMSILCSGAAGRITAAAIKDGQRGVRRKGVAS
jgi:hypothetical protein